MRRAILVAIPVLGLALVIQTAIISRITLLNGNADLVLLVLAAWGLQEHARAAWVWGAVAGVMVGLISGVPWYIYLLGYLAVVGLARLLMHRIWQAPLLAMFLITFTGTLVLLILTYIQRTLLVVPLSFGEIFPIVILPSVLLNMLLAIPVHAIIRDLANRLYPSEAMA